MSISLIVHTIRFNLLSKITHASSLQVCDSPLSPKTHVTKKLLFHLFFTVAMSTTTLLHPLTNPLRVFSNGVHPKRLSVKSNRFISPYCYKPCPKFYFVCICLVLRNKVIAIFINDHVEAVTGKESLCSQAVLINSIDGRKKNRHLRLAGTPRNSISLICNFLPY